MPAYKRCELFTRTGFCARSATVFIVHTTWKAPPGRYFSKTQQKTPEKRGLAFLNFAPPLKVKTALGLLVSNSNEQQRQLIKRWKRAHKKLNRN